MTPGLWYHAEKARGYWCFGNSRIQSHWRIFDVSKFSIGKQRILGLGFAVNGFKSQRQHLQEYSYPKRLVSWLLTQSEESGFLLGRFLPSCKRGFSFRNFSSSASSDPVFSSVAEFPLLCSAFMRYWLWCLRPSKIVRISERLALSIVYRSECSSMGQSSQTRNGYWV